MIVHLPPVSLPHPPRFDFDPLDVTKVWPEELFPLQPVGRLVLNRNIDNFFNENEQLAFCPALVVPGGWEGVVLL
jgi:catalase